MVRRCRHGPDRLLRSAPSVGEVMVRPLWTPPRRAPESRGPSTTRWVSLGRHRPANRPARMREVRELGSDEGSLQARGYAVGGPLADSQSSGLMGRVFQRREAECHLFAAVPGYPQDGPGSPGAWRRRLSGSPSQREGPCWVRAARARPRARRLPRLQRRPPKGQLVGPTQELMNARSSRWEPGLGDARARPSSTRRGCTT